MRSYMNKPATCEPGPQQGQNHAALVQQWADRVTASGLQACSFDLVFEAADDGREEGFAVLPEWADLQPLQCAIPLLQSMPWEPHSHILRCAEHSV